jgi:hypothetical protein
VDKHYVCFVYLLVLFSFCLYIFVFSLYVKFFLFIAMLLIGHSLHHNYGLHIIGVFNVFEHYLSLEIPIFDSCIGLETLHV